ncbi:hypothetical protein N9403_00925 [Gammaproteobacteria bacterium]|nr:hypothetical protein [Gammaproteobacteria bacterium]
MKIVGILLIIWGFADLGLSWVGTDLYYEIGIELSDAIYPFTHWIAMGIGYGIYSISGSDGAEQE